MTRINVVPVTELVDKHLVAEYRELPRALRRAVLALYKSKTPDDYKIPNQYKLGTGHEIFFIDKANWLWFRWRMLQIEMRNRGMSPSASFQSIVKGRKNYIKRHGKMYYNDYEPTKLARQINRERIKERLSTWAI